MTNGRRLLILTLGSALAAGLSALPVLAGGSGCTQASADCSKMIAEKMQKHGWIGLELEKDPSGELVISKVHKWSPADRAGFKAGDVLVAMNGVPMSDHEKLKAVKASITPGAQAKYTVKRGGAEKNFLVQFAEPSKEVIETAVAKHLAEHANEQAATR